MQILQVLFYVLQKIHTLYALLYNILYPQCGQFQQDYLF